MKKLFDTLVSTKQPDNLDLESVIEKLLSLNTNDYTDDANIHEEEIIGLCAKTTDILLGQPTVIELLPPVNVLGDIHGQFKDLIRWFDKKGFPPQNNYLFLGDYVDRGTHSIETICLLMAFKIKYPVNFFLLRGNHESRHMNLTYGFYNDCLSRYNNNVFKKFTIVFNSLPLAAVIDSKIFCCHGGIGPKLKSIAQIFKIKRPVDVPNKGIICDLVWADPNPNIAKFENNPRGVSYSFGQQALSNFLTNNELDLMCRGHEVVQDGYDMIFNGTLVTIFSAPNYCNTHDNAGAMMCVNNELTCSFEILPPKLVKIEVK